MEIYRRSSGVLTLAQTLSIPKDRQGRADYGWNIAANDDFFAIGSEQYYNSNETNGAVFIYERQVGGNYPNTPVILTSSEQTQTDWRGFGIALEIHKSTLFVQGLRYNGTEYNKTFYIAERPSGGWQSGKLTTMLETPGYVYYFFQIAANDNYFFTVGEDFKKVDGFKKNGSTWSSSAIPITINDLPADNFLFGAQIQLSDNHLTIGCINRLIDKGVTDEFIFDYYSPTGAWETRSMSDTQSIRHTATNATDDFFGDTFAVFNGILAVNAKGDDEKGADTGVVYLFDATGGNETPIQKVFNPEEENFSGFGQSIAMVDSLMFIGAPWKDSVSTESKFYNLGKVYIYRLTSSGWQYESAIRPPNVRSEVSFGQTIAWAPGYCAVTEFYGGSSESIGRVHIYKESKSKKKFEYIATLDPKEHLRSDFFGQSIVMSDSLMVVGAGNFSPDASYRHRAYVFLKKGEWKSTTEDARLNASDVGWSDHFGQSVSAYGNYIVVGAPYSPGYDNRPIPRNYIIPGAAYVYKRPSRGWTGDIYEIAKLSPSDPSDMGAFGYTVAIDHNDIFVGSPNVYRRYNYTDLFNNSTHKPGSVYHFAKPGKEWLTTNKETRKLQSFEPEPVDGYGARIYVSDRLLLVGVPLDDTKAGFRTESVQTMLQLPAFDAPTFCIDETPRKLLGFPKGGHWSGKGINSSTGMFSPTIAGAGTHLITYEFQGCETTMPVEVLPGVMMITNKSPDVQTKCFGKSIQLAFQSTEDAANYTWYHKNPSASTFTKVDSLKQVITVKDPGTYRVRVTRGACMPRDHEFTVLEESVVDIVIQPVPLVCANKPFSLSVQPLNGYWSGNGVTETGLFDPAKSGDGIFSEVYTFITPGGCIWKDSIDVKVSILQPPLLEYDGQPICGSNDPAKLVLTNTDFQSTTDWYKDGKPMGAHGPMLITYDGGKFFANVSKGTCKLTTEEAVVIREDVMIKFSIPPICSDEMTTLGVTPPNGTWTGQGITPSNQFDPLGLSNGSYPEVYTLVTPVGCTWKAQTFVIVDKLLQPGLTTNQEMVCFGVPATLSATNVDERSEVQWYSDGKQDPIDSHNLILQVEKPATYWVTVTKGACSLETQPVTLTPIPDSLFIPNVFTPNGDKVNEQFEARHEGLYAFHLSVFNRYGKPVFETDNPDFRWNGDNTSPGIYYWRVTYRSCAEIAVEKKGWVQVVQPRQ